MGTKAEKFISFCEKKGIGCRPAGAGIRLKDCPECGSSKWKMWLYDDNGPLVGKCAKCEKPFSAKSYLLALGFDRSEVESAAGLSYDASLSEEKPTQKAAEESPDEAIEVLPDWMPIEAWEEHPAAHYAKKRGYAPRLKDGIMINPSCNGVVFLVHDFRGNLIGYQTRFVNPIGAKTSTMKGFASHKNILYFINAGKELVVCEGPFDAVGAWRMGYSAACCFGSNVTIEQMKKINTLMKATNAPNLILGFDTDKAGQKAQRSFSFYCSEFEIPFLFGAPSIGKDIGEAFEKNGEIIKSNGELIEFPDLSF